MEEGQSRSRVAIWKVTLEGRRCLTSVTAGEMVQCELSWAMFGGKANRNC